MLSRNAHSLIRLSRHFSDKLLRLSGDYSAFTEKEFNLFSLSLRTCSGWDLCGGYKIYIPMRLGKLFVDSR